MLTYKIEWEKEEKAGSFTVTALTDDECIQAGHDEVKNFGGEVLDYYQISPSTKPLVKALTKALDKKQLPRRTLKTVKELLLSKGANSVKIVTLLDKPQGRVVEVDVDYVAFTIPDEFVIGFGLDFDQKYRNLPYVGVLKEECYKE